MLKTNDLIAKLESGAFDEKIQTLYVCKAEDCKKYAKKFQKISCILYAVCI